MRPDFLPVGIVISWLTNALLVLLLTLVLTRDLIARFHIHGFATLVAATAIVWLVSLWLCLLPGPWQLTGGRGKRARRRA